MERTSAILLQAAILHSQRCARIPYLRYQHSFPPSRAWKGKRTLILPRKFALRRGAEARPQTQPLRALYSTDAIPGLHTYSIYSTTFYGFCKCILQVKYFRLSNSRQIKSRRASPADKSLTSRSAPERTAATYRHFRREASHSDRWRNESARHFMWSRSSFTREVWVRYPRGGMAGESRPLPRLL